MITRQWALLTQDHDSGLCRLGTTIPASSDWEARSPSELAGGRNHLLQCPRDAVADPTGRSCWKIDHCPCSKTDCSAPPRVKPPTLLTEPGIHVGCDTPGPGAAGRGCTTLHCKRAGDPGRPRRGRLHLIASKFRPPQCHVARATQRWLIQSSTSRPQCPRMCPDGPIQRCERPPHDLRRCVPITTP